MQLILFKKLVFIDAPLLLHQQSLHPCRRELRFWVDWVDVQQVALLLFVLGSKNLSGASFSTCLMGFDERACSPSVSLRLLFRAQPAKHTHTHTHCFSLAIPTTEG